MDKRFLTAFLQPEKIDIFGYKLDPFSYRHLLILEVIESPYIRINDKNVVPTPLDTLKFLKVCSTKNWQDAFKMTLKDKFKLLLLSSNVFDYSLVNVKIATYVADSFSIPKFWSKIEDEKNTKTSNSFHQSILTVAILMSKFNFSEEDAWNMSICKSSWYTTAFTKIEGGDVDVIRTSDEERSKEDLDKLKKIEQDAINKYSKILKGRKVIN